MITDVNALFGPWPIQRTLYPDLGTLDAAYAECGIDEVWLSATESILAPDPRDHDRRLFSQMAAFPRFRPVLTLRPTLTEATRSLLEAARDKALAPPPVALKLFPSYHSYPLDGPEMEAAVNVARCLDRPLLVQIRVNDERNQPPVLQVPPVDAEALAACSRNYPDVTFIALSATSSELDTLCGGSSRLYADSAFLDGADALLDADERIGSDRLCNGSMAGLSYPHAATLKLCWSRLSTTKRGRIGMARP